MNQYITIADENNLISIAHQYGYKWERLKEHPNNAQLFKQHPDHLRLPRGQQLYLPKHQTKTEPLALYTTNVFVLKNKTRYFSVILCWPDKTPIANRPYQLDIGPIPVLENSASNGLVEHRLPAKTPRQVTLTVWPYSEHPDESIEWIFDLNTYEHKSSSKGNKNYLTLHRHTVLEQSQISQEIEAEATDNIALNKEKGVHSSATGITSTRNLHPLLIQQGLEFLKQKHKIRLLEEKSLKYKENQENQCLSIQQNIAMHTNFFAVRSCVNHYISLKQNLHTVLTELDVTAKENKLIKNEVSFQQQRDDLFDALLIVDKNLSTLKNLEEVEHYKHHFDSRLKLFNQCSLQTDEKPYSEDGKAYQCVHQFNSRPIRFVYKDETSQPIANSVILYWMYSDTDENKLAIENKKHYQILNIMMPLGMGFTDSEGYLSQSTPHLSPAFASGKWLGQQVNEVHADLENNRIFFENKTLYKLDWSIKQAHQAGQMPGFFDSDEKQKQRRVKQDIDKLNKIYSYWPEALSQYNNFRHWEKHYNDINRMSYWGGLGSTSALTPRGHNLKEAPMPDKALLDAMPFNIPFKSIDTGALAQTVLSLSDDEKNRLENYTRKLTNKLFYTHQKYGFIVLPPNALNFKTKDLLALAEQAIEFTDKNDSSGAQTAAWSGTLSPTMKDARHHFAPIELYCTLPEWNRRLQHIMDQLHAQLEKKSLLMAPHIHCAAHLDLMENFSELSGTFPFEKQAEFDQQKQTFARHTRAFNSSVFEALNAGRFTEKAEDKKTEQLAKELSALLDNTAYIAELKRFLAHLGARSEDELATMQNCSLYFDKDEGYMRAFEIIQQAYSLLSQTQYGMSELFWTGHIKPAFEAISEHPEIQGYFDEFESKELQSGRLFGTDNYRKSTADRLSAIKDDLFNNADKRAQEAKGPLSAIIDWYNTTNYNELIKSHFMTAPGPPPTAMIILTQWGPRFYSKILQNKHSTAHLRLLLGGLKMFGFIRSKKEVLEYLKVVSKNSDTLGKIGKHIRDIANSKDKDLKKLDKWLYHKAYNFVRDDTNARTEALFAGKKATYFRAAVQLTTLASTLENLLSLDEVYKDYQNTTDNGSADYNALLKSFSDSALIFTSTGLALQTTRTTLHRLGRHSGVDFFKRFAHNSDKLELITESAERLAIYTSVFMLINSAIATHDELSSSDNDLITEKSLARVRDLIFSTATLTGYLMQKASGLALTEGMAWVSIWGARLLSFGLLWGLVITIAWEATVGMGRKIKSHHHKIADLMAEEGGAVTDYFERNKEVYHTILQSESYQQLQDQADFDLLDWLKSTLLDDKDNIPWGSLNWRAIIPAYELGLDIADIEKLVSFPRFSTAPLYPMSILQQSTLNYLTRNMPDSTEKSYYQLVLTHEVLPMGVKAVIAYYQRLLDYPNQSEAIIEGLSYADCSEQLRLGTFSPELSSAKAIYKQQRLYQTLRDHENQTRAHTGERSITLLHYDRIKSKQEKDGVITYEHDLTIINGRIFSWNHPMFRDYI